MSEHLRRWQVHKGHFGRGEEASLHRSRSRDQTGPAGAGRADIGTGQPHGQQRDQGVQPAGQEVGEDSRVHNPSAELQNIH